MHPLAWPAILLFLGLVLLVLEVFTPSGGILGFLSGVSIVSGIAIAFYYVGAQTGFVFLTIAAIAIPVALATAFKYLPYTPIGRRILIQPPSELEIRPDTPELRLVRSLVGKQGVAQSMMLPSGAVEIEGRLVDAVSEGAPIEPGQTVEVLRVEGTIVTVRKVMASSKPKVATSSADSVSDILSRPIDSLGIEPLDDPLA